MFLEIVGKFRISKFLTQAISWKFMVQNFFSKFFLTNQRPVFRSLRNQSSDIVPYWFLYCANVCHKLIMLVLLVMILIIKANLLSHRHFYSWFGRFQGIWLSDVLIPIIWAKSNEFGKIKLLISAFTTPVIKFVSFDLLFVINFEGP